MSERPLEGKTAVITGASRGIGREIALKLAEAGANIVGNSVDPKKQKRVDEVMDNIREKGVKAFWCFADISKAEGRGDLVATAHELLQETNSAKVDYLFLNAAGGLETGLDDNLKESWAEQINVWSQLDLVEQFRYNLEPDFRPSIKQVGAVIYLTSLWSEQFGKVKQPPFYRPVARSKFLAERRLRELIPDLSSDGIKLGFICGHIISGTAAHTLMSRSFPEFMAGTEKTAEGGRFPTAEDMADAVLNLVISDFKSGDTAYVGGRDVELIDPNQLKAFTWSRIDIRKKLSMYSSTRLLVDEFISPKEDELGYAKETGIGKYTVRTSDTNGHFTGKFKGIKLFRGVDREEAAAQTLGLVFLALEPNLGFLPAYQGLDKVRHLKTVSLGETVDLHTKITYMNSQEIKGNCQVRIGDEVISEINGISLGLLPSIEFARRLIAKHKAGRTRTQN